MSNRKVTDLVVVDQYYSNVDDEYSNSYGGTAHVPVLENPKITDLVVVENYDSNVDDEYSNSNGGTAHVPVPENHPPDHDDPSPAPNCVLKLKRRSKHSADIIKALLRRRLGRKSITIDVQDDTVAICGDVSPGTAVWKVSECAEVRATLVFYKEHPRRSQGKRYPPDCENIVFSIYGDYWNVTREKLLQMNGINSIIVDSSHDLRLWMSISGDCFNSGIVRKKLVNLCDCSSKKDIKVLSKKIAKQTAQNHKAANDTTNISSEGNGALVSIDDPIVTNSLTKNHRADLPQIIVDFIVPRNHERECATEINKMLLSTKGVNFVVTHFRASRLASVRVYGDDLLELDTILKTVSYAGGIKPRLRKSLISQLISAFGSFCHFCG